jgi:hypothetical protein
MTRFKLLLAAAAALVTLPAFAHDGVHIQDPYARTMGGIGASGAVFFTVMNHQSGDDRLIDARSDVAQKVELHTHKDDGNGVMQMVHVPEGFVIPAEGTHALERGGDHVMLMGLTRELKDGDMVKLTLVFEKAGEVEIEAPVDNARKAAMGGMDHSAHQMAEGGEMDHSAHSGHGAGAMVDTTGMADPDAIAAVMKAQFDTPENPLTVEPVMVEGDNAIAGWAQGEKGGRALLAKRDGKWEIVLCGGPDLRMPEFLGQHGVSAAETLSKMYNAAEDGLGEDKVKLFSSFEGVVMISPMQ